MWVCDEMVTHGSNGLVRCRHRDNRAPVDKPKANAAVDGVWMALSCRTAARPIMPNAHTLAWAPQCRRKSMNPSPGRSARTRLRPRPPLVWRTL
jgi:hypothetical protein